MEIKSKNIEITTYEPKVEPKMEKAGKPMVLGIKKCKTYRKALETLIGQQSKRRNEELRLYTMELLKLYNDFHPKKKVEVEIKRKKGKSPINIIQGIDELTITKFQKNKDRVPQEYITRANREELTALCKVINNLSFKFKEIPTKDIAVGYCLEMGIKENNKGKALFDGNFWERFFSWRSFHYKFTTMLSALDSMELIEYNKGKTKLIKKPISVQMIL